MPKKTPNPAVEPVENENKIVIEIVNPLRLLTGVNFRAEGEEVETRIEAGIIEAGTLPPAFEQTLRDRKQLFDV